MENVKDQKCTINKFWVKNKIIQNVKDQSVKKPKVAIDVPELLQCRDSERDEVTTPEILLKRKGRDYEMNVSEKMTRKTTTDLGFGEVGEDEKFMRQELCSYKKIRRFCLGDDRSASLYSSSLTIKTIIIKREREKLFLCYRERKKIVGFI